MAKNLVAVFLMCMVVLAAVNVNVEATAEDYKACYKACFDPCFQDGKGKSYTTCEMDCDVKCYASVIKAQVMKKTST